MLAKHWQHWQSVGKFADVLPTLPTDGQHWPDLACLLGNVWKRQIIACGVQKKLKTRNRFKRAEKIALLQKKDLCKLLMLALGRQTR